MGDDIPICAQAVGLAHDYDNMVVAKGYSHEQAVGRIRDGIFNAFSPVLVETFQLVADNFKIILEKNPSRRDAESLGVYRKARSNKGTGFLSMIAIYGWRLVAADGCCGLF